MSVFTKVTHAEAAEFIKKFPIGELLGLQGIGEGVENTNYYVDTTEGRWVLTLFERLNYSDLPFFLGLMEHLARRAIPCPAPVRSHSGEALLELNGKPAAIVQRLIGQSVLFPTLAQCAAVGRMLGDLHLAGQSYSGKAANARGAQWRRDTADKLVKAVDPDLANLIRDELAAQSKLDLSKLPQGVVHADLFRDNVLFLEDRLTGVIDFYYACVDSLAYDLAVTANDWCVEPSGKLNSARWDALISAYCSRRVPTADERAAWPLVVRAAAFRFWLSRLHDWRFPREGDVVHIKDPAEYQRVLMAHRASAPLPL